MNEVLLQYGVLGVVVIGLASYILKIEARHKKERDEWREQDSKQLDRVNQMNDTNNQVLREHTNILQGLKTLLENRK